MKLKTKKEIMDHIYDSVTYRKTRAEDSNLEVLIDVRDNLWRLNNTLSNINDALNTIITKMN